MYDSIVTKAPILDVIDYDFVWWENLYIEYNQGPK